jgi:hypothetical protein
MSILKNGNTVLYIVFCCVRMLINANEKGIMILVSLLLLLATGLPLRYTLTTTPNDIS